jgi:hypothetical protein
MLETQRITRQRLAAVIVDENLRIFSTPDPKAADRPDSPRHIEQLEKSTTYLVKEEERRKWKYSLKGYPGNA